MVLATVPANTPALTFLPYIGDYMHDGGRDELLRRLAREQHTGPGQLSAGRDVSTQSRLRDEEAARGERHDAGRRRSTRSSSSAQLTVTHLTNLTLLTHLTKLTNLTATSHALTSLTHLTPLTKLTLLTSSPGRFRSRSSGLRAAAGRRWPSACRLASASGRRGGPFIRFGNTVFAPEQLDSRASSAQLLADALAGAGITRLHQLATADA
jgi:hypothetical protein